MTKSEIALEYARKHNVPVLNIPLVKCFKFSGKLWRIEEAKPRSPLVARHVEVTVWDTSAKEAKNLLRHNGISSLKQDSVVSDTTPDNLAALGRADLDV